MPVELIKKPQEVFRIVGEETSNIVVEENINVPDINPDIYKILHPSVRTIIKSTETAEDKVSLDAQVLMDVLYAADTEGRPVNNLSISADLNHVIEMAGVKPQMKEWIDITIQHIDCQIINSRKINIRIIMDINCRVEDIYEIGIPVDVRDDSYIQVLKEDVQIKESKGIKKERFNLRKEIDIASDGLGLGEIIKTDYKAFIKECEALEDKVQIDGILLYNVIYKAEEDGSIQSHAGELDFREEIEMLGSDIDMEAIAFLKTKEVFTEIYEDPEEKTKNIILNLVLDISAEVFKENRFEMISDLYSPKQEIEIERGLYNIDELLSRGTNTVIVKESLNTKHTSGDIEKVCFCDAYPLVNEVKVMDDKVGIEGIINVKVLYKSSTDSQSLSYITKEFPYKLILDMPRANMEMNPHVKVCIENIAISSPNRNTIDLRIVLLARVDLYKKADKIIIKNAVKKEEAKYDYKCLPTATIYVVSANDTLWKIAKKYNTTVDALVKINNIENPDKIYVGQKILILKDIRFKR